MLLQHNNQQIPIQFRQVYLLIFILIITSACQPAKPDITPTQHIVSTKVVTFETATNQPEKAEITVTATAILSSTPTLPASLSLTPALTNTLVPTTTPSLLYKIGELPIKTSYFVISNDGMLLATENRDTGILYVYDTKTWEIKWEIDERNRGMTGYTLDFSPDGRYLAGGGTEQDIYVWDMLTGKTKHILIEPYNTVNSVSFSPDSKLLLASTPETHSSNNRIMVWDVNTGKLISQFPAGNYGWNITDAAFIPNHQNLIAIAASNFETGGKSERNYKNGGLYFWNLDEDKLQEISSGYFALTIGFSPDGQLVATYIDGNLHIWDQRKNSEILDITVSDTADISKIDLTNTGFIANKDTSGIITVWTTTGKLLATLNQEVKISDMAFTPEDNLLIAYSGGNTPMELWKIMGE